MKRAGLKNNKTYGRLAQQVEQRPVKSPVTGSNPVPSAITYTGGYMQTNANGYILCPKCGRKTKTKIIPGTTVLTQFPLYCPWCHEEILIDYK